MNIAEIALVVKEELARAEVNIMQRLLGLGSHGISVTGEMQVKSLPENPKYAMALSMYKNGGTHSGVAKALGVSVAKAKDYYSWLVKHDYLPPETGELSAIERQVVDCLYDKGMSLTEAATALNCAVANITTRRDSAMKKGFREGETMSKYTPLGKYLEKTGQIRITLTFAEIEQIIGGKLPAYLRKWEAGWYGTAGGSPTHYQKKAWCSAGYQVETLELGSEKVVFYKV